MTRRGQTSGGGGAGESRERARRAAMDRLVNRVLDAEADGALHHARDLAAKANAADPSFDAALRRTREAVGELTLLPSSPDVSARVLARVDLARPFTPRRVRRRVTAGRLAMATGALATFAAAMFIERAAAPVAQPPAAAPVSGLVTQAQADFACSIRSLADAADELREGVFAPVGTLIAARHAGAKGEALTLGNADIYDTPGSLGSHRPTLRLAMVSVPINPAEPIPADRVPSRRVAGSEAAHQPVSVLIPAPITASVGPSPAVRAWDVAPPGESWWWDGTRWHPFEAPR